MSNQIANCPVTAEDIDIAQQVWGKDISALKGKTTRSKPVPVKGNAMRIPRQFLQRHKHVLLTADIFFINQIPFLVTLSRNIDFTSATHLADRKIQTVFKAFKEVWSFYRQRGFNIQTLCADGEFSSLASFISDLPEAPTTNFTAANEHVPEIERRIRMIKERVRAVRSSLPFKRIPRRLAINMVL